MTIMLIGIASLMGAIALGTLSAYLTAKARLSCVSKLALATQCAMATLLPLALVLCACFLVTYKYRHNMLFSCFIGGAVMSFGILHSPFHDHLKKKAEPSPPNN